MAKKTTAKKSATTTTTKKPATLRTAAPADGWRDLPLDDAMTITVKVEGNPYRGKRAERWTYENGMTVGEVVAKGTRRTDVRWDVAKGYIALSGKAGGTGKHGAAPAVPSKAAGAESKPAAKHAPAARRLAA